MYTNTNEHEWTYYQADNSHRVRTHYQKKETAVLIPLFQAFVTGIFLGIMAGVLSVCVEYEHPWRAMFLTWAGVQSFAWLALLVRWAGLVKSLETALNYDIDRDGVIGEEDEEEEIQPVKIEVIQNEGRHVQFADLPITEAQLVALAVGVIQGASFSEGQWTGKGAPFSRSEFRTVRDLFIRRGWLEWVNPSARSQGLELTAPGHAVMRHFASMVEGPPALPGGNGRA